MTKQKGRLYEILGVKRDASTRDIVKAYRIAALKTHPDKLARLSDEEEEDAKNNFIQLQHAYEILKDDERRKKYDDFGWEGEDTAEFAAAYEYYKDPITTEDIDDFSKTYKGSKAEEEDLVEFYKRHNGDLTDILLYVPLSETNDIERFISVFNAKIEMEELKSTKMFKKTSEKSHIKMIKQKYAKKMRSESKRSKSSGSYDDLAAQIMANRKKRQEGFSSLIDEMEKKYATKKLKK